jgi:hypothetical protein
MAADLGPLRGRLQQLTPSSNSLVDPWSVPELLFLGALETKATAPGRAQLNPRASRSTRSYPWRPKWLLGPGDSAVGARDGPNSRQNFGNHRPGDGRCGGYRPGRGPRICTLGVRVLTFVLALDTRE